MLIQPRSFTNLSGSVLTLHVKYGWDNGDGTLGSRNVSPRWVQAAAPIRSCSEDPCLRLQLALNLRHVGAAFFWQSFWEDVTGMGFVSCTVTKETSSSLPLPCERLHCYYVSLIAHFFTYLLIHPYEHPCICPAHGHLPPVRHT